MRLKMVVVPCVLDGSPATTVWCPRLPDRARRGILAPQLNVPFEATVVVHSTVLARLCARSPLKYVTVTGLPGTKLVPLAITPVRTRPDAGDKLSSGTGGVGVIPEITVSNALLLRRLPVRLPRSPAGAVAVMVETPGSAPVASPCDPRVANAEDEDQVTRLVRFSVLRSDMRPVAVNC
jgi:hypothetical protein